MPFTLKNLREDLADVGSNFNGAPPGTWRGYEAGPGGLELLVVGAPNLGENPRADVEGQRGWWAD